MYIFERIKASGSDIHRSQESAVFYNNKSLK